ncbi:AbiEi antitoxin N-terminal domain-containing protein [Alistipes sp.]|nr:AbiEi antitoxin N-terminal domain-containing protein [Alistipes sp.]
MSTTPQTKINQLLQALPSGAVYLSSWMKLKNISNDLQHRYIKSAWLTPIGTGVMIRTGDTPTLYGAMYSLNTQADKHLTIGAMSALEIHGYSYYLPMGRPTISLSAPQKEYLPL